MNTTTQTSQTTQRIEHPSAGTLYIRGNTALLDQLPQAVTVTGSRSATSYGTGVAVEHAQVIAHDGHTVVTGGGFGIDAAATRGAMTTGGQPIIVQAGSLDRAYPGAHAPLFAQVLENGGLLVSLVPDGTAPTRTGFLARSAWMGTHTGAVLIVEAGARSGALAVAEPVTDPTRLGAVPGPVTSAGSQGPNGLIAAGRARCVYNRDSLRALLPT